MTIQELIDLLESAPDKSAPGRLITPDGIILELTGEIDYSSEETAYLEVE